MRLGRRRFGWRRTMLVAGAGALTLASALYVEWSPELETLPGDSSDAPAVAGRSDAPGPDGAVSEAPATGVVPRETLVAEEGAEIGPAALWQVVDEATVTELPDYKEVVEGRVLIRVTEAAAGWSVGQRIVVPIPQLDEVYTPVVERIEHGSGDIRSYVGTLTEATDGVHRFTITTGPRNTFAHLSTPFGTYELVARGELGWLMPTVHMDGHVDYSVPDFNYPEGPHFNQR